MVGGVVVGGACSRGALLSGYAASSVLLEVYTRSMQAAINLSQNEMHRQVSATPMQMSALVTQRVQ